jgi:hypothetical protein
VVSCRRRRRKSVPRAELRFKAIDKPRNELQLDSNGGQNSIRTQKRYKLVEIVIVKDEATVFYIN